MKTQHLGSLLLLLAFSAACGSGGNDEGTGGSGGNGGSGSGGNGTGSSGGGGSDVVVPSCEDQKPTGGFHATIDGTPGGDGSLASPWDLATALLDPPGVAPGDTIWVHAGHYKGTFVVKQDGEEGKPITIRAMPGERVTLDGDGALDQPVIQIYRAWTVLRDLEITNSNEDRRSDRATGIYVGGDHITLANLAVHDVGVGISGGQMRADGTQEGTDIELYGSLFYNNGYLGVDRGHGHHTYLTNRTSVVRMEENVLFYAYGFGVHNYSANDSKSVRNMELVGNVWFLNGVPGQKLTDGCMIGHDGTEVVSDITLRENFGWAMGLSDRDVRLGWSTPNENATLKDNYFVGLTIFQDQWTGISMSGNSFIGSVQGVDTANYPDNTYLDAAPAKNHVVLRPNRYEPGRAHIIAYNWEGKDEVSVDPSAVVPVGAAFVVRNVQNFYGPPVVSGTYEGGEISIPVANLPITQPVGDPEAIPADQRTGAAFNVFVLQSAACE